MLGAWLLVTVSPLPALAAAVMVPAMVRGLGAVAYRFKRPIVLRRAGYVELAATSAFIFLLMLV